jgi:murein DD-endopeptidase MepM/ murein hydrolase activator NlpD
MGSSGTVKVATCLLLALVVAGCTRAGAPAPVTWRVPPGERAPERPAQRTVERAPQQRSAEPRPEPFVERPVGRPPERPAERPAERNAAPGDSVVVGQGETLYAVARRANVPLRSLIEANNLQPPFRLVAGRRLTLPQVQEYVAQQGDTVYSVSRRFGVDSSTLASTNNLTAPYAVQSGAPLILPPPVQTASPPPAARQLPPVETPRASQPIPAPDPRTASPTVVPPPPTAPPPAVIAALPPTVAPPRTSVVPPIVTAPPAPPPLAGRGFEWPVRGPILAGYGPGANGTQNDGINIAAPLGTPVLAVDDGVVKYAGNELRGFGNLVLIKHQDGWISAYAHCESLLVKRDERVRRSQPIARVGATGAVSTPQLHFELRRGARAVDPMSYLPPVSTAAAP